LAVLFAFGKVSDEAPWSEKLTEYDEAHFFTYARLLDLLNQGKNLKEISQMLFEIDAEAEPERAQKCFASHLKRAKWATTTGYQLLLTMPEGFQLPKTDKRH
jgi:hypothetical protein